MQALPACLLAVLSYSANSILLEYSLEGAAADGMEQGGVSRVDTVIVLKTLDEGSTFLDVKVFPKLPHVSRWGEEISNHYMKKDVGSWQLLADWFKHKPGEEIVGGSMEFGPLGNDWCTEVMPLFTRQKHGSILLIKLGRNVVEKWVNILRRESLYKMGCEKSSMHLPRCLSIKATIDVDLLYKQVTVNDLRDEKIDDAIACGMRNKSSPVVATEHYPYVELQMCQGIPRRINRHFGNDEDGCDRNNTYLQDHPLKQLHEIVSNHAAVRARFRGTKWEHAFASQEMRFFSHGHGPI